MEPCKAFEWPISSIREKNWLEAAKRWEVLCRAYPDHPTPFFNGVTAYLEAGDIDRANELLDRASDLFPKHPNCLLKKASIHIYLENWDKAEECFLKAQKEFERTCQVWIESAKYAEVRGDIGKALNYAEKACTKENDVSAHWVEFAEIAMRAEKYDKALSIFTTIRDKFPGLAVGYTRAADAARSLGNVKEARRLILMHQYGHDLLQDDQTEHELPLNKKQKSDLKWLVSLVWTKATFNLRSEVHHNYLSYGWWVIEPLLHMLVYYTVFGLFLQRGGENYTLFLMTGLIPWMWFMKGVNGSSGSILAGQNLIMQAGLPSVFFPLVSIVQVTIKQIPVFIVLVGFVWLQGSPPDFGWWSLIPVMIVNVLLILMTGLAVAAVIPFIRDLSYLVPTGLTFVMFLSGIFYDYKSINPELQAIFLYNPIAFLLKCYREIFIYGIQPDFLTLSWFGTFFGAGSVFMLIAYKRLRYIYPRIIAG